MRELWAIDDGTGPHMLDDVFLSREEAEGAEPLDESEKVVRYVPEDASIGGIALASLRHRLQLFGERFSNRRSEAELMRELTEIVKTLEVLEGGASMP